MVAEEGARSLVMRAAGELVYRRLLLFDRAVDATEPINPLGLHTGFLEPEEVDEYARLHPGAVEVARERLAAGDRCFCSRLDGRLVSTRWMSTGTAHVEYLAMDLPLGDGEFYIYDSYTAPELRGRDIARCGQLLLFAVLAAEGFVGSVCACLPENRPALRSIVKGGYEPAGKMGFVRLGRWRREFVRRRPPQATRQSSRSTA